jgi:hypothetical protein
MYEVTCEVILVDDTRGKVIGTVTRRAKSDHEHRIVQFENGLSGTYPVTELLAVEVADANEPVKAMKASK